MAKKEERESLRQISKDKNHSVFHENTFQMEPRRKFQSYKAKRVAQFVVDKWLKPDTEYTADLASNLTTLLAQETLYHLKNLNFERYRYVVQTHIGQKRNQGLEVASRALFDGQLDSYAEYYFENRSLWCVVLIHGIYFE